MAELVAAAGVILSLIFVGLELRQNTAAVRGATFQALSDASASDISAVAHNPDLVVLLEEVYFDDVVAGDFSSTENTQIYFYYLAFLRRLENSYFQFTAGIVDDRIFESYGWNDAILTRPHFREFWKDWGGAESASSEFAAFFESRIDMQ